jgi:tetratricopeptide (TPR) repeat protein
MDRWPGLSVCMIVKDEQAMLPAALASLEGLGAEILVGDTGSTDRTIEIAQAAGATVIAVPWTGDFAAARNVVVARATQPWVLYFDADERLSPESVAWLQAHLARLAPGGYRGVFISAQTQRGFDRLCLFPNDRGIRWHRPLHEWPVWPDGAGVDGPVIPALQFLDEGTARSPQTEKAKHERYVAILQAMLAAHPGSQLDRYYLAMSLNAAERHQEATDVLLEAWHRPEWRDAWIPGSLAWQLADCAKYAGDWPAWRQWCEACVAEAPDYVLGWELLVRGCHRYEGMDACVAGAEGWLDACLRGAPIARRQILTHPTLVPDAWRYRVWSLTACGRWPEAMALAQDPAAPSDLRLHCWLVAGDVDRALAAYCQDGEDSQARLAAWQARLAEPAPGPDLVLPMLYASLRPAYYFELAEVAFERLVTAYPDDPLPLLRRGRCRLQRRRDPRPALADLGRVLELDPGNREAARLLKVARQRAGTEPTATD